MSSLAQSVADLTFAFADREAVWLNRYNKDNKSVEWAFKEGFYQKRIRELLRHIPAQTLLQLHARITNKLEDPAGEQTRRRSVEEMVLIIRKLAGGGTQPSAEEPRREDGGKPDPL